MQSQTFAVAIHTQRPWNNPAAKEFVAALEEPTQTMSVLLIALVFRMSGAIAVGNDEP